MRAFFYQPAQSRAGLPQKYRLCVVSYIYARIHTYARGFFPQKMQPHAVFLKKHNPSRFLYFAIPKLDDKLDIP